MTALSKLVNFRVPIEFEARVKELAKHMERQNAGGIEGRMTVSRAFRMALDIGVEQLEAKYKPKGKLHRKA